LFRVRHDEAGEQRLPHRKTLHIGGHIGRYSPGGDIANRYISGSTGLEINALHPGAPLVNKPKIRSHIQQRSINFHGPGHQHLRPGKHLGTGLFVFRQKLMPLKNRLYVFP
jgi:hypothetical protein